MAKHLTPTEIKDAFRKWRVPHVLVPGWETRSNSGGWGTSDSVTGVMYHHTAGDASDAAERNVLVNGRTGLRGPLCNFGARDDGIIDVIAAGAANHAGGGDPDTLRLVQQEKTPLDREIHPNQSSSDPGSVGGNSRFYGWESYYGIRNDPSPNTLQHRVTLLSMAAIIDALDIKDGAGTSWTGRAMIGHREWTPNKIDPSKVNLAEARVQINALLKAGPAAAYQWYKTGSLTAPVPTPPKPEVPPVAAAIPPVYRGTNAAQDVVKSLLASDVFANPSKGKDNPYWSGQSYFAFLGYYSRDAYLNSRALIQKVDDLTTSVAELHALVEQLAAAHLPAPTPEAPQ